MKTFGSIFNGNPEIQKILGKNIDVNGFLSKSGIDSSKFDPSQFTDVLKSVDLKDPTQILGNIKNAVPGLDLENMPDITKLATDIQENDLLKKFKNIASTGSLKDIDTSKLLEKSEGYIEKVPGMDNIINFLKKHGK